MTTLSLDSPSTTTSSSTEKHSWLTRLRGKTADRSTSTSGVAGWRFFYRTLIIFADFALAITTATTVIPMLAAWLHRQAGIEQAELTTSGTLALWGLPLVFLVALLTVAEVVMMRGMWRWATRGIEGRLQMRAVVGRPAPVSGTATKTANQTRSNTKKTRNR